MANGACQPHRAQRTILIKKANHAKNGFEFDQQPRNCGIVKVDFALLNCLNDRWGKRVRINLQPEGQRLLWREFVDSFVQPELAAPELLVTEGVKSGRFAALVESFLANSFLRFQENWSLIFVSSVCQL